jgi:ketosteroid isomerase-like protein
MHPNEAVVRAAAAAVADRDPAAYAEVSAPDVIVHFPGTSPVAGDHHGRGVLGARIRELTGSPLTVEVVDVLGSDDHAVGVYRMTAHRGGDSLQWLHMNLYRIVDGRIAEVWQNPYEQDLVDAFLSAGPAD